MTVSWLFFMKTKRGKINGWEMASSYKAIWVMGVWDIEIIRTAPIIVLGMRHMTGEQHRVRLHCVWKSSFSVLMNLQHIPRKKWEFSCNLWEKKTSGGECVNYFYVHAGFNGILNSMVFILKTVIDLDAPCRRMNPMNWSPDCRCRWRWGSPEAHPPPGGQSGRPSHASHSVHSQTPLGRNHSAAKEWNCGTWRRDSHNAPGHQMRPRRASSASYPPWNVLSDQEDQVSQKRDFCKSKVTDRTSNVLLSLVDLELRHLWPECQAYMPVILLDQTVIWLSGFFQSSFGSRGILAANQGDVSVPPQSQPQLGWLLASISIVPLAHPFHLQNMTVTSTTMNFIFLRIVCWNCFLSIRKQRNMQA